MQKSNYRLQSHEFSMVGCELFIYARCSAMPTEALAPLYLLCAVHN